MSRYIISTIKNAAENVIKNMQIDKHGYIGKQMELLILILLLSINQKQKPKI